MRTAIHYFLRDGLVIVKDRPGHVAGDVAAWARDRGIPTETRQRTLGRATHWEVRRTDGAPGEAARTVDGDRKRGWAR